MTWRARSARSGSGDFFATRASDSRRDSSSRRVSPLNSRGRGPPRALGEAGAPPTVVRGWWGIDGVQALLKERRGVGSPEAGGAPWAPEAPQSPLPPAGWQPLTGLWLVHFAISRGEGASPPPPLPSPALSLGTQDKQEAPFVSSWPPPVLRIITLCQPKLY